ncbi:MAG: patatin-like phospholipase family protein [Fusobacteriaceae bacterium]
MKLKFTSFFSVLLFLLFTNISLSNSKVLSVDEEILSTREQIISLENKLKELRLKKETELANVANVANNNNNNSNNSNSNSNSKVGLVLSGGGSKGLAHIGVLRELEKNNIKIDYISGTSMGAIVATLYSIGYSPDEIENILFTLNIEDIINGIPDRKYVPLEMKLNSSPSITSLKYDDNFSFSLPKGLNDSNISYLKLKSLLWKVEGITDFDKFPIPLRIIATDLNTGQGIAFKSGDLARALTASMAIPTIMDPIRIGDNFYVDGMIARNFPVQDLVSMGADIIIGSDVGGKVNAHTDYDIISVFNQLLAIQSSSSTPHQAKLASIVISPDIHEFSPNDFSEIKPIIATGEKAAKDKMNEILKLIPKTSIVKNKKEETLEAKSKNTFLFKGIVFEEKNLNPRLKEVVEESFKNYKDKDITKSEFENVFNRLHAMDFINKIYYTLDEKTGLFSIDIDENPHNKLGVAASYRSDYGSTFKFSTDILTLGKRGSISKADLKFGDYNGFNLSNFTYYGLSNKVGIFSSLGYDESPFILYKNNDKKAKYISRELFLKIGISSQLKNSLLMSYGISLNSSELILDTGDMLNSRPANILEYSKEYGNAFFNLKYDTLDSMTVPSSGIKSDLIYTWGGTFLDDSNNINFHGPVYSSDYYLPLTKKLSIFSGISGGIISGNDTLLDKFLKIGGTRTNLDRRELSFAGYHFQSNLVEQAFIGELGFSYEFLKNFYFIGKYNIGTFKEISNNRIIANPDNELWKSYIQGAELGFTYDSIIGPMSLVFSANNDDNNEILTQFNIGYYLD